MLRLRLVVLGLVLLLCLVNFSSAKIDDDDDRKKLLLDKTEEDSEQEGSGDDYDYYDDDELSGDYDDDDDDEEYDDDDDDDDEEEEIVIPKKAAKPKTKKNNNDDDIHFEDNLEVVKSDDDPLYEYYNEFYEEDYEDDDDEDDEDEDEDDDDDDDENDLLEIEVRPEIKEDDDDGKRNFFGINNFLLVVSISAFVTFVLVLLIFCFVNWRHNRRNGGSSSSSGKLSSVFHSKKVAVMPFVVTTKDPRKCFQESTPIVKDYQRVPTSTKDYLLYKDTKEPLI